MTYGLGVMLKNIYRGVWQSVWREWRGWGARSVRSHMRISQSERRKMRMRSVYCEFRFFVSFSTRGRVKVRTTFKVVPSGMRQRAAVGGCAGSAPGRTPPGPPASTARFKPHDLLWTPIFLCNWCTMHLTGAGRERHHGGCQVIQVCVGRGGPGQPSTRHRHPTAERSAHITAVHTVDHVHACTRHGHAPGAAV